MTVESIHTSTESVASLELRKPILTLVNSAVTEQVDGAMSLGTPEQTVAEAIADDPNLLMFTYALAVQDKTERTAILGDFATYMSSRIETGNGYLPDSSKTVIAATPDLPLVTVEAPLSQKTNKIIELVTWLQAKSEVVPELRDTPPGTVSWSKDIDPSRVRTLFANQPELTIQKRVLTPFEAMTDNLIDGQALYDALGSAEAGLKKGSKMARETAILTVDVLEILAKNFGTWLHDDNAVPQQAKLKFLETLTTAKTETLPELKEALAGASTELQSQADKLFVLSYYAYINAGNKIGDVTTHAKQELSTAQINPNRRAVVTVLAGVAAMAAFAGAPTSRSGIEHRSEPVTYLSQNADATPSVNRKTLPILNTSSLTAVSLFGTNYGK